MLFLFSLGYKTKYPEPAVEPQQSAVEPQQPAVEPQQSAVEPQQPAVKPQQSAVEPQQPAVEPQQSAVEPQQPAVEPQQSAVDPQQSAVEPQQPAVELQPPPEMDSSSSGMCDCLSYAIAANIITLFLGCIHIESCFALTSRSDYHLQMSCQY